MKSSVLILLFTAAYGTSRLQAGEPIAPPAKNPAPIVVPSLCDCFDAGNYQLSVYGAGIVWDSGGNDDALGGGLSFGYFFTEHFGFEADATWLATGSEIHHFSGSLVLRYPIKSACLAPYILVGGGILTDSETVGTFHVGGGIDIRLAKGAWCPGIFADARYTWADYDDGGDFALIRAGFRFNM